MERGCPFLSFAQPCFVYRSEGQQDMISEFHEKTGKEIDEVLKEIEVTIDSRALTLMPRSSCSDILVRESQRQRGNLENEGSEEGYLLDEYPVERFSISRKGNLYVVKAWVREDNQILLGREADLQQPRRRCPVCPVTVGAFEGGRAKEQEKV